MKKRGFALKRFTFAVVLIAGTLFPILLPNAPTASAAAPAACTGNEDTTWTQATDNNWAVGSNWTNGVPTPSDSVCIPGNIPGGTYVTVLNNRSAATVTVEAPGLLAAYATLSVTEANIAELSLGSNGYIDHSGRLDIGTMTINGGAGTNGITGAGDIYTTGSVTLLGTGTKVMKGNWTSTGQIDWYAGSIDNSGYTWTIADQRLDGSLLSVGTHEINTNTLILTSTGTMSVINATINGDVDLNGFAGATTRNTLINGDVDQSGGQLVMNPNTNRSTGFITRVTGDYVQSGGSVRFAAYSPGTPGVNFDELLIDGTYTISGNADVLAEPMTGYTALANDSYAVINAGAPVSGEFVAATSGFPGLDLTATYPGNTVTLTATPPPATISGNVYLDNNDDNVLDGGETTAVSGRTVFADIDGDYVLDGGEVSTVTDGSGAYTLTVPPGSYWVRPVSNPLWVTNVALTSPFVVTSGQSVTGQNIGLFEYNKATGTVFDDTDRDGVKDVGELGIGGVTVYEDLNNNGSLGGEPSTTTASDGTYSLASMVTFYNPHRMRAVAPGGKELTTTVVPFTVTQSGGTFTRDIGLASPVPIPTTTTTTTVPPTTTTTIPPAPTAPPAPVDPPSKGTGYWLIGNNGAVYPYGEAANLGSPATLPSLNAPVVSINANPAGGGYWAIGSDGGVFAYGTSKFFGSAAGIKLNANMANIQPTPTGNGYWLVAKDGGVFAYGDAQFYGSAAGVSASEVVGIASTPTGKGYWLVASDGGVFAYGDAKFFGSMAGKSLNSPIVGIAADNSGNGYYLVAADGGVFAFGSAPFHGSAGGINLAKPIVSMRTKADGSGYVLIASDGGVFAYGTNQFLGAPTATITAPVVQ